LLRGEHPKNVVRACDNAQHCGPIRSARTIVSDHAFSIGFQIYRKEETLTPRRRCAGGHAQRAHGGKRRNLSRDNPSPEAAIDGDDTGANEPRELPGNPAHSFARA